MIDIIQLHNLQERCDIYTTEQYAYEYKCVSYNVMIVYICVWLTSIIVCNVLPGKGVHRYYVNARRNTKYLTDNSAIHTSYALSVGKPL